MKNMINSKNSTTTELDFNASIRKIRDNVGFYFPMKTGQWFPRALKRAIEIRNRISHQCIDLERYVRDLECLSNIADAIGHHYIGKLIRKRRPDRHSYIAPGWLEAGDEFQAYFF